MESRRNGPQPSMRHDDDGDDVDGGVNRQATRCISPVSVTLWSRSESWCLAED